MGKLTINKKDKHSDKENVWRFIGAIVFIVALIVGSALVIAADNAVITYSQTWPEGDAPDGGVHDIITIDATVPGEPSSVTLTFYMSNRTLIIEQYNVENVTLYYDRALREVAGENAKLYEDLIVSEINVVVKGDNGHKFVNITMHNVPKLPETITKDGQEIPFERLDADSFVVGANPTGNYTITFEEGGASAIADAVSTVAGTTCYIVLIAIGLIITIYIFKVFFD